MCLQYCTRFYCTSLPSPRRLSRSPRRSSSPSPTPPPSPSPSRPPRRSPSRPSGRSASQPPSRPRSLPSSPPPRRPFAFSMGNGASAAAPPVTKQPSELRIAAPAVPLTPERLVSLQCPLTLAVAQVHPTSVTLRISHSRVAAEGADPTKKPRSFEVQRRLDAPNSSWRASSHGRMHSATEKVTCSKLSPASPYVFRVRALMASQWSLWSKELSAFTPSS